MQQSTSATLEANDASLATALIALAVRDTPEAERRVAQRYLALGVLDAAADHFARACRLNRVDAVAYDGLAKIWRDWGFPEFALGDAMRATYYAPRWAPAQNTLGTVLTALGHRDEARRAYERALALDPRAAYILSNLCYLSLLDGSLDEALVECNAALEIDPNLSAARANVSRALSTARP